MGELHFCTIHQGEGTSNLFTGQKCKRCSAKMKHNTTTEEKCCDYCQRNGSCEYCPKQVAHTPDSIGKLPEGVGKSLLPDSTDWHNTIEGKVEDALGNVNVEIVELIKSEKALSRAEGWTDAIRAVFSGDTVELDGKFYKLSNPDIYNYLSSLTPKEDKL